MLKKYISLVLATILLLGILCSCGGNLPEDTVDTMLYTDGNFDTDETADTQLSDTVVLTEGRKAKYTVVFSRELSLEERNEMKDILYDLNLNHDIVFYSDIDSTAAKDEETANEILVGNVNRKECQDLSNTLLNGEYVVRYNDTSKRVSIIGSTTALTVEAFKYFIDTYVDIEKGEVAVPRNLHYSYRGEYPLLSVAVNGVMIEDYVMVVPSEDDLYSYYTALNIADYFRHNLGAYIPVVTDETAETDYEILIGDTNRDEDDVSVDFEVGQYLLLQRNNKIVMRGYGIYVAAAAGEIISDYLCGAKSDAIVEINDLPTEEKVSSYVNPTEAKNVIIMIGDGMGYNQINATLNSGLSEFAAQSFKSVGSAITQSQSVINGNASYTDSAAAATALATGYKTINGYIGKAPDGSNVQNVRELADLYGANTAIITTDDITGATPSCFLTHNISRYNVDQLQSDIDRLKVQGLVEYCEGSVGDSLTDHTRTALNTVAYSDAPFFMMVEEGYIDKNSHSNKINETMAAVVRFNDAIIYTACFVMLHPETALIITADHETGGLTADSSAEYGYSYTTGNHTNADVPVYAIGGATDIFNGEKVDNTDIADFMAKQFGATSFGS